MFRILAASSEVAMKLKFLRSAVVRWVARRLRVPIDVHQIFYFR